MRLLAAALFLLLPAAQAAKVDFAAYGDCRSGHETHRRICASMIKAEATMSLSASGSRILPRSETLLLRRAK